MPTTKPRGGECPPGHVVARPMYLNAGGLKMGAARCEPRRRYWPMRRRPKAEIGHEPPGRDLSSLDLARAEADQATAHALQNHWQSGEEFTPWVVWDSQERRICYVGRARNHLNAEAEKARKRAASAQRQAVELAAQAARAFDYDVAALRETTSR